MDRCPTVTVTVEEIDRESVSRFVAELTDGLRRYEELLRSRPEACSIALAVDLTGVRFMDSTGIRALIDADQLAVRHGGRLRVSAAGPAPRRALEVAGVWDRLAEPPDRGGRAS